MKSANPPVYLVKGLPSLSALFRPDPSGEFAHALDQWEALGLRPIVEHVAGNGTLLDQGERGHALVVWPPGTECPPLLFDDKTCDFVDVDDALAVCWKRGQRPGPDDLDNGNPLGLNCHPVRMADGQAWQVPELREVGGTLLPCDLVRDRQTGDIKTPVKLAYHKLWEDTEHWFRVFCDGLDGQRATFNLEDGLDFATRVLSLRYHFSDATQAALRLVDSVNLQNVIATAIGWPAVLEWIKAKAEDEKKKTAGHSPSV